MQTRPVTSRQTSLGYAGGKPSGAPASKRRRRGAASHQDVRSFAIAGAVGLALAAMVGGLWFYLKPVSIAPSGIVMRAPPSEADLAAKKTHSYWKIGQQTYRHYITDAATGEIVDAGPITVKEMLDQGIEVPGYSLPGKTNDGDTGSAALAKRFQALQDHLK